MKSIINIHYLDYKKGRAHNHAEFTVSSKKKKDECGTWYCELCVFINPDGSINRFDNASIKNPDTRYNMYQTAIYSDIYSTDKIMKTGKDEIIKDFFNKICDKIDTQLKYLCFEVKK